MSSVFRAHASTDSCLTKLNKVAKTCNYRWKRLPRRMASRSPFEGNSCKDLHASNHRCLRCLRRRICAFSAKATGQMQGAASLSGVSRIQRAMVGFLAARQRANRGSHRAVRLLSLPNQCLEQLLVLWTEGCQKIAISTRTRSKDNGALVFVESLNFSQVSFFC